MFIKGRNLYWLLEYHDVCKDFLKWSQKFFIGALGQILITLVQKLYTIFLLCTNCTRCNILSFVIVGAKQTRITAKAEQLVDW